MYLNSIIYKVEEYLQRILISERERTIAFGPHRAFQQTAKGLCMLPAKRMLVSYIWKEHQDMRRLWISPRSRQRSGNLAYIIYNLVYCRVCWKWPVASMAIFFRNDAWRCVHQISMIFKIQLRFAILSSVEKLKNIFMVAGFSNRMPHLLLWFYLESTAFLVISGTAHLLLETLFAKSKLFFRTNMLTFL